MFIVTWLFDKLGYMPKINMEVGKVDLDLKDTWPFPEKKKPVAKKKPVVVVKTARKPKTK
jgi:hypothetical protein